MKFDDIIKQLKIELLVYTKLLESQRNIVIKKIKNKK
jgi:hypothetical protein